MKTFRSTVVIVFVAFFLGLLIIPILFSAMSPVFQAIPGYVLDYAEEQGFGGLVRVNDFTYRLEDGRFLSFFFPQEVEAASFTYYGTEHDGDLTGSSTNYSTAHDAATGTVTNTSAGLRVGQEKSGSNYNIYRAGLFFDTSALPDEAVIGNATLGLNTGNDYSVIDFYVCVVDGDELNASGLVTGDYGDLGNSTAVRGYLNSSYVVNSTYNYITLSVAGIDDVNKTGTSKFGLRSYYDIMNVAPVGLTTVVIYPETHEAGGIAFNGSSGCIPSEHWECVNEVTPNDAVDYLYTSSWWGAWFYEYYNMTNVSAEIAAEDPPISITVTQWAHTRYITQCDSPGEYCSQHTAQPAVRVNGTNYLGTSSSVQGTAWVSRAKSWSLNPYTLDWWTWEDINNLQGYNRAYCKRQDGTCAEVTQYQISISYQPGSGGTEYIAFQAYETAGDTADPFLAVTYATGNIPGQPTDLLCNDEPYPQVNSTAPYFSAVGHHADAGETMTHFAVWVDDSLDFQAMEWNSGQVPMEPIIDGERCEDILYMGAGFLTNTRYYWMIKFWDSDDDEGLWSDISYFDTGVLGEGIYDPEGDGGGHQVFIPDVIDEYDNTACNPQVYLHELFESAATAWGYDCSRPVMVAFTMVLTIGWSFGILVASRSVLLAIIAGMMVVGGSSLMGITPWWIVFLLGMAGFGGWFALSRSGV